MNSTQSMSSPGESGRPDLAADSRRTVISTLLRTLIPVLLVTLIAGYAAREYSERRDPVYEATARVVLSSASNYSAMGTYFGGTENRYVQNQASIMTTLAVLDRAAAILADGVPGTELRGRISAASGGANDVITITAQSREPALAARRADAVAAAYAAFTAEQVRIQAEEAAAAAADPALVRDIRARAASFGDGVAVIEPAAIPESPASPTPGRDAYLAATAAFLLSGGLALLWLNFRRPTGKGHITAELGAPLLGEVPVRWFGSLATPRQPGSTEYGIALQALRYSMGDTEDRSVLLTAVGRDTSATSALLGLAAADAARGRDVVLLDVTRDGRLFRRAGVPLPAVPLTSVGAGTGQMERALVDVPALAGPHGGSVRIARAAHSSMAGAESFSGVFDSLRTAADLVLVDAGAPVHDATAFALLGQVGAVVAVVRARTRSGELPALRRQLALAGRTSNGVLLTRRTWLPPLVHTEPAEPASWEDLAERSQPGTREQVTHTPAAAGRSS